MQPPNMAALLPFIEVRFGAASGPGGQHVNKTSTGATLLLDFESCPLFLPEERDRIRRLHDARLSRDGRLQVRSQRHRTQAGNRRAAEGRLLELLAAALRVPKPRRATRPTAGSRRRRLRTKRLRAATKRERRARPNRED